MNLVCISFSRKKGEAGQASAERFHVEDLVSLWEPWKGTQTGSGVATEASRRQPYALALRLLLLHLQPQFPHLKVEVISICLRQSSACHSLYSVALS